jgi:hypothetical protein
MKKEKNFGGLDTFICILKSRFDYCKVIFLKTIMLLSIRFAFNKKRVENIYIFFFKINRNIAVV